MLRLPTSAPAASATRWWLVLGVVITVAISGLGLWRILAEPSLGYRFVQQLQPNGTHIVQGIALRRGLPNLPDVKRLEANGRFIELTPLVMLETGGVAKSYADQRAFYAVHRELWALLQGPQLRVHHALGTEELEPAPKSIREISLLFWVPWVAATLVFTIGLAVWLYSADRLLARLYGLAALSCGTLLTVVAGNGDHLLSLAPNWAALNQLAQAASYVFVSALSLVLWWYPSRLGGNWVVWVLLGYCSVAQLVHTLEWAPNIDWSFRYPTGAFVPLFGLLLAAQWWRARADPVKRLQVRWFALLFAAAFPAVVVLYVLLLPWNTGGGVPQNYGFTTMALVFLGMVPLATRLQVFKLERWWLGAWLWLLGGVLVLAIDVLLLAIFPLNASAALGLALAIAGWVYFPLRQWLLGRLGRGLASPSRGALPEVLALATSDGLSPEAQERRWHAVWEQLYLPAQIVVLAHPVAQVSVAEHGRALLIPPTAQFGGLRLQLAQRGQRLFNAQDAQQASEMVSLIQMGLQAQAAQREGAMAERKRIASDLHDDLGAQLLRMAQSAKEPHIAQLARQALDDMRLAVRGLTAPAVSAAHMVADWRAETMARLDAAGLSAQWEANDAPSGTAVRAQTHVQLTRILREAITNAIRHAKASDVRVTIAWDQDSLRLTVSDNGSGFAHPQRSSLGGTGLNSLERRVRQLGGQLHIRSHPGAGTTLQADIALPPNGSITAP